MSQGTLKVLVDTSALYPLLKKLGNALWKEYKQGFLKTGKKTMEEWSKIIEENSYIHY